MEQIADGGDGLVVRGCHPAIMEVKLTVTGDLLIPLENVACKSGDLLAVRLI